MRRVAILSGLTALLLATAAPAFAQNYPPEAAGCTTDVTVVSPGATVAVDCGGWLPNSEVEVLVLSTPRLLGTATTDAQGNLAVDVTLPTDLSAGDHTLRFSGTNAEGEPQNVDIAFTVEGAAPGAGQAGAAQPEAAAGLPVTGDDSLLFGLLALGLFTAGGGALYAARRRSAGLSES